MKTQSSSLKKRFDDGVSFESYLDLVEANRDLWRGVYDRVSLSDELLAQAQLAPAPRYLLALSEDWCGDAVNILPWVERMAQANPNLELRVLGRDANLDIIDAYLTNGRSRSIPVVIVLDEDFREIGWWGPRPKELQKWVMGNLDMDSGDRYKVIRRRYARDKGKAIINELMEIVSRPSAD